MTTRVLRIASCGTLADPAESPSSVMLFASGRSPATENADEVESVAPIATTPGASVARTLGSDASMGSRSTSSGLRLRSASPGPGRSASRGRGVRPRTVISSSWVAALLIRTFATNRSSSAWRASVIRSGAIPMYRTDS